MLCWLAGWLADWLAEYNMRPGKAGPLRSKKCFFAELSLKPAVAILRASLQNVVEDLH